MRLGLLLLLIGCGEVQKLADAPPTPDDATDAPLPIDGPPGNLVPRLYALTAAQLDGSNSKTGLEIVDLRDLTPVRRIDLQVAGVTALAVAPDGRRAYVGDFANQQLRIVDLMSGTDLQQVPMPGIRDLVLSADGSALFAATGTQIAKLDTATNSIAASGQLGGANTTAIGIALSPDGAIVAVSTTDGGGNPTVTFAESAGVVLIGKASITTPVTGCGAFPDAVRFLDANRLLAWDSNCDAMYQVDVSGFTQIQSGTVATGRDSGSAVSPSSRFAISSNGRAYAVREAGDVAAINLSTQTFSPVGGFTGQPLASAMSVDGKKLAIAVIHRFNSPGGPDTLSILDTATNTVQQDVFAFSDPTQSVLDSAIVASP